METWIKIGMDNDAFVDNQTGETARILQELAKRIDGHPSFSAGHDQSLRDINGNEVGFCGVYDEPHCIARES
jgi:hypothetical protein